MPECPTCDNVFGTERAMKIHHTKAHDERLIDEKSCKECDETYEPTRTDQQYCSTDCAGNAQVEYVAKTCPHCEGTFEVPPCESGLIHCSLECRYNARRETLTCANCAETFTVGQHAADRRQYCSNDCKYDDLGGWGEGPPSRRCEACGRTYWRYEDGTYCSVACRAERQRTDSRPDDLDAHLRELYAADDHNLRETWLRLNAARDDEYRPRKTVRARLKALGIFNTSLAKQLRYGDVETDTSDAPDGDDSWRAYYRRGGSDD